MKKFIWKMGMFLLLSTPITVYAHPGRTDASGGHTCRTNCAKWNLEQGEYHYHNKSTGTYANSRGEVFWEDGTKIEENESENDISLPDIPINDNNVSVDDKNNEKTNNIKENNLQEPKPKEIIPSETEKTEVDNTLGKKENEEDLKEEIIQKPDEKKEDNPLENPTKILDNQKNKKAEKKSNYFLFPMFWTISVLGAVGYGFYSSNKILKRK